MLRLPCAVRVLRLRAPCTERCGDASSSDASSGPPLLLRLRGPGVCKLERGMRITMPARRPRRRLALRCGLWAVSRRLETGDCRLLDGTGQ